VIDRRQRLLDRFDRSDSRRRSPADHENVDAERARRLDLGVGGAAAAVLGDDGVDAMVSEERQFGIKGEWAAVEDEDGIVERERWRHGIDAADQIEMPQGRLGGMRLLSAGRQKDAARRGSKCADGFGDSRDMRPPIAGLFAPERAAQRDGWSTGLFGSLGGIGGNSGGIGMGGIHEQVKFPVTQKARKSVRTAESANSDRNRLFGRFFGSPRERQQDIEIGALPQSLRQQARLACAAEHQNAEFCHV